ncbi:DUF2958 domain-containing protein [Desulfopila inferna]|uniref:DUF2958 domain-containing protein n=1 Tax=Desulfopila inferna TaxID=468528 RepID=UPI001962A6F9|nr:DUF2958 domain-containing protein [Desulfopila inferna]MBM9606738.1 DUF2958 domain-containing protein [Desulfopila inferna]
MWNKPTKERLEQIPGLYKTENVPLQEKLIYLHFFIGNCDWFVAEFDGLDTCFGFVILDGEFENAEWGYFALSELGDLNLQGIEIDCELEENWQLRPAKQVNRISDAQGWLKTSMIKMRGNNV